MDTNKKRTFCSLLDDESLPNRIDQPTDSSHPLSTPFALGHWHSINDGSKYFQGHAKTNFGIVLIYTQGGAGNTAFTRLDFMSAKISHSRYLPFQYPEEQLLFLANQFAESISKIK